MAEVLEPVSQAIASTKLGAIAPYIRDDQYTLRDLGALRRRSLLWSALGALVGVIALGGAMGTFFTSHDTEDVTAGALVFLVPCLGVYLLLLAASVRMRAVTGQFPELAAYDSRKPILYLRNFASENPDLAHDSGLPIATKVSFEHFIGTFFWKYGRVLALGDPLQRRATGSVSRLFVSDAGWRDAVAGMMAAAQAILIHYGAGANVDWEVDQSQRVPNTPRLVILNITREEGQRRVSDIAGPAGLQAAFAASKVKLPAGPVAMIGLIRSRKGEAVLAVTPDSQGLAKLLNKFKRALERPEPERLPPQIKALRDRLHSWTYLPALLALPGIAALVLLLGAAWLAPGLWRY